MNNINLNLYKTFYEVAKYGSISKAAQNTYTSQSAISKSIKRLEEELEAKLFHRKLSGVELTDKGKELYYYVDKSYNNLLIAQRNMIEEESLKRGKIKIGMPSNIGSFFLFDKVVDFHNKYSNIEITIITGSTSQLLKLLDSHKIDFIVDTSPINIGVNSDFRLKKLSRVYYCFVVKKDTKFADLDKIEDLESIPLILPIPGTTNRNDLEDLFLSRNIIPNNVINIHTSEMIISAVKKGLGVGYVIENLVENEIDLKVLDISNEMPYADINIVYNTHFLTTAPKKFIEEYINKDLDFE